MESKVKDISKNTILLIIVASLGYFVDIYDLIIYNIVKYESLEDLGFTGEMVKDLEIKIFNWQMFGMLLGGVLWGVLGDKIGRIRVLFGSILLYSLANIANAWVINIPQYCGIRFLAGFGLAGELGAGITIVSELMSKEKRGIGTMIIVSFGVLGTLAARYVGGVFGWQGAYIVGGLMGLALLLLRMGTLESTLFNSIKKRNSIEKGNFFKLFSNRKIFFKYLSCILLGSPIWYVVGILMVLGNRFAETKGVNNISIADNIMIGYVGICIGDIVAGTLSQVLKSRKKVIFIFITVTLLLVCIFLFNPIGVSPNYYYWLSFALGIFSGYWGLFVTVGAEQFGTNIRSTVANTVPNFVRGLVPIITISFVYLSDMTNVVFGAFIVGMVIISLSLLSLKNLKETFAKDLDYVETFIP